MPILRLFRVLLVLWAGSLWSLIWVTSVLFYAQDDRHLAGVLAGKLFSIEAYVGVAVAALAFLLTKVPRRTEPLPRPFVEGYLAAALLAANEWALRPVMAAARTARHDGGPEVRRLAWGLGAASTAWRVSPSCG